ncbi:MAG: OsmC family protein [Paraglaciecola sp.]|uniref:OsmC family protein n=1 Tax=Pseudomonadati TaxID=3379134 RepID=UPI00273EE572|nr:OsmC family protein [Paraglaciecola sp.]MDP5029139.1 OsmC family protein [Paraglaciecola sp.]MDP5129408.1 OsmC family protein [Paraglaciecola sp.]
MKAKVSWQQGLSFLGETDSGRTLVMDGNAEAISPMESVLLAVGSCSSIDVVDILQKSRLTIEDCYCELTAERADSPPKVFTKIHAHYVVKGHNITDKHMARAVQLSAEKYCSVMLMLSGNVAISTSYAIESE